MEKRKRSKIANITTSQQFDEDETENLELLWAFSQDNITTSNQSLSALNQNNYTTTVWGATQTSSDDESEYKSSDDKF